MAWTLENTLPRGGTARGILAILASVALLSLSDALVKLSGDRFGLAQLVLLRSLVAALLLALWLLPTGGVASLRLRRPLWVWLRSLCLAAMWLCYYAALPSMTLALAAACYYTAPVWMALLGRFVLGMTITGRGWAAILLSLSGVLLAVAPAPGTLTPVLLLPLAAGGFYALAGIVTYRHCQAEHPGAMALTLNLCLICVAALGLALLAVLQPGGEESFVLSLWPRLMGADWGLVVLLGALLAIIATAVALAYRLAPTPVVGVVDTAYLGFAALWSAVFFAEVPSAREAIGLGLIAGGAVLMSGRRRARDGRWPLARGGMR
ncbi:DMT family transporter [Pseudoroseicyclus aestuarii]|uniref:Threonine/homoserine efflux transporter RhtA n=1 Tax=Pseudoroseicyclus aestuarii TaxID=1795041 RepID=A0A318SUZ0_9RHOB|nr:DMT family transporter [Pseudoroseicyclus aestuarii]PYE85730.1 threonine/homoserine efflux transporter RhtA [Pseudoroseicyclus aestuarii]